MSLGCRSWHSSAALGATLVDLAVLAALSDGLAVEPVELIAHPLGQREELGRARDHHQAGLNPAAAGVTQQRAQQLGDAAAGGRRFHVPDRSAAQLARTAIEQLSQRRELVGCSTEANRPGSSAWTGTSCSRRMFAQTVWATGAITRSASSTSRLE